MRIRINEIAAEICPGASLASLAEQWKPGADVLIRNGFPAPPETMVRDGDEVYLIKRGERPTAEELQRLMAARHTPGVHARLQAAVVGIAGVGGLGSAVAVALARTGVGRIVIADFDVVEPSNLNRQQYFIDQVGQPKTAALADNLARINPAVTVEPHQVMLGPATIPTIFAPCAVVVEAFDRADMKAMLVETLLGSLPSVTVVAASGVAGYGPNNAIATRRAASRLYLVGDGASEARPGCGLMAPRVGIAAGHQANQVLRIILGEEGI
ncbi:sulfur carrier protein ThiS adenylyltransferase ThiF [Geobacter sp. FeAm09]|uniref:sulfur carrier protein ThiS adenylyltransferase ThiF n=1 Tax=Geobacter sp. FeAm09 TaxID=2597769 RepID=UPI0011EE408F|nr:sulfur carrier protein ThiS adenylyltransferase ThiF [Geobacter sp. FeAm09]QEM69119.1 sulfur carrier protein ThiS adenylyltransferase ThiF [Geobacter sp. FeAm09]